MTEPQYHSLPDELSVLVSQHWQRFVEAGHRLPDSLHKDLPRVWAGSDYVAEQFIRDPQLGDWLAACGLTRPLDAASLAEEVQEAVSGCVGEDDLKRALRRLRHRHMSRIIWRDLAAIGDYHSTVADLSLLADTLISVALERLYGWACERNGTPVGPDGEAVRLVVLAMGKLGARELNLSSDIDLIFAYEHEGEVPGERRPLSHNQFFLRLGQQLIKVLDQTTADGFVFRVDMRLRPWGKSGALAIGFDAMEGYYETQGREWERYALIKMRPVAGDLAAGARLIRRLNPFVYRRYIDFGAFQSLREMKALIEREVNRKGMQADVKLGAGGIREVEFIVQAFQLIRGGQLPALRQPNLMRVLPRLVDEELLPEDVAEELMEAYLFLRNVEHRLQAVGDRQTQRLPDDELGWQRLTFAMGFSARAAFERQLRRQRENVRYHFSQVIADPEKENDTVQGADQELLDLWLGQLETEAAVSLLENIGVLEAPAVYQHLCTFRDSRAVQNMQAIGRERLDRVMPLLLEALGYQGHGETTVTRLLAFMESVLRRSAYIALLVENPDALTQLVKLSGASPWIAERLTLHPVLLDELLDVRTLYSPPERAELDDELRQQLLRVAEDDLEQQMEVLRNFKQAHLLRVAASEVTEVLPLMKVSDYLTWLAESILNQVVMLAWEPLVERHGRPSRSNGQPCNPDFVVVGYGKLGGIELGHNSDLDLVFLHDAASGGMTDGDKPVANEQFYARLGQRIVHILSTRTMSGQLYDVDTRLRPSGSSGLLVSSMDAFEKYQRNDAWTWEHQALVRARVVAGCARARQRFDEIRAGVLCRERPLETLREDVLAMRRRMVDHLAADQPGCFHLKQDPGGIVDIEFMVQYGVLRWASSHGELTRFTDNVRLLETLAALDLMSAQDAGLLREAYLAYRSAAHRASLRKEKSIVDDTQFRDLREGVRTIWTHWFDL
ncbi:glutamate-ammonia-ligase adenylyltransferase [Alcanivorax hongdengensis A-11-3]|uniref:Bifunctional glutamine synthetase adenylyltransferase/adenylyl-removing enzyme n=1 Tax=Alcanivorax hongdengensis A-11-3 TaxID=1177179 RepID=L0WEK7_9GAMM|nr:bifunctional [glutamate--ammonia ligase]-adenylyl-L-tyrosine phosphorylase/[glutamate--ammonia-ligase] adenylyltransferase [Alcanivorax hongdengensis]EKF75441.1 glutamate-ammonia-ligase adenylyltransferase [Alcanivorax hongdengensis A-11-3]